MTLYLFLGFILIALGSFSAGSFAVPFGAIKNWKWESYWVIFSAGAYLLLPFVASTVFSPEWRAILRQTPDDTLLSVFILGAVYGIGNLSFGLSLRYLGLSLGYSLSLGLMLAIGTLLPPLANGKLNVMMEGKAGGLLISGVVFACIGIAFTGWAGYIKSSYSGDADKNTDKQDFNFVKGSLSALLVGVTGSAMSLGFERGIPISKIAEQYGTDPLFAMMPVLSVLLSGTFSTTLVWCFIMGLKNKSLTDFIRFDHSVNLWKNYLCALLAALLWFSQFITYSMGNSMMGSLSFVSWGILMALTIVTAALWGIYRREWRGAPRKIYYLMIASLVLIILSSFVIGISGSV